MPYMHTYMNNKVSNDIYYIIYYTGTVYYTCTIILLIDWRYRRSYTLPDYRNAMMRYTSWKRPP